MDFAEKGVQGALSRSVPRCGLTVRLSNLYLRKSAACLRLNCLPLGSFFVLFAPFRGYSRLRFSSLRLCGFA
jgi:hypothetical protein